MKKYLLIILACVFWLKCISQNTKDSVSTFYLEDQIYVSLHYNLIEKTPESFKTNGFSGGFSAGFIKDIPFNEKRNIGVGIGLGYAYNAFIQNLKIEAIGENLFYTISEDFISNKLSLSSIEIPIELRWRTSDSIKYKFWRIYGGLKFSYVIRSKSKYTNEIDIIEVKNVSDINNLNYGLTFATGYGHWNLYVYYGLKPVLEGKLNNVSNFHLRDINIGLKFYIM